MPLMKLSFSPCLTIQQFKTLENLHSGYWWLRKNVIGKTNKFVKVNKTPGYYPFNQELKLPRGKYTLGCGKSFRHHFEVT